MNIRDIKRRIKSVTSTQQITRAMEMVAAAKLRKAQARVESARPFTKHLEAMLPRLISAGEDGTLEHPLLRMSSTDDWDRPEDDSRARDESAPKLLVLFTGDRGLCGSYNSNLIRAAQTSMEERPVEESILYLAGKKGADYFNKRKWKIAGESLDLEGGTNERAVKNAVEEITTLYKKNRVREVVLLFAEFKSAMTNTITFTNFLPLESGKIDKPDAGTDDYIIEPDPQGLLDAVVPRYCHTLFLQAILESFASEQGARMVSMGAATQNAGEMIDHLTLLRNKARQAGITSEISEIVGGAEALKG